MKKDTFFDLFLNPSKSPKLIVFACHNTPLYSMQMSITYDEGAQISIVHEGEKMSIMYEGA